MFASNLDFPRQPISFTNISEGSSDVLGSLVMQFLPFPYRIVDLDICLERE